jgi:hypothetical protein
MDYEWRDGKTGTARDSALAEPLVVSGDGFIALTGFRCAK